MKVLPDVLPAKWVGLAVAALGVLIVALRYVTKLPIASLLLPLVLAAGLAGGCSISTAQRLDVTAQSVNALHAVAAPAWSEVCKGKAEACVEAGVTASQDCAPWVACQAALKRYYEAHTALQRGIQTAAWYLLNDNADAASKALYTAQMGLAAAYELAKAEGAIK
jgi:hypothetical protein